MNRMLAIALLAVAFSASSCGGNATTSTARGAVTLSEDEKHRLYSAALAASESPLDTETFKDVCKKIGIFDAGGNSNDKYMAFIAAHVEWATKPEADAFRREINSREKAREYISRQLPR